MGASTAFYDTPQVLTPEELVVAERLFWRNTSSPSYPPPPSFIKTISLRCVAQFVLSTSNRAHYQLEEDLPFTDDEPKVRDWDYAPTAIDWPKFRSALNHVKEHGTPPSNYDSFDHLNKQVEVGVDETIKEGWKRKFAGVNVRWCIVDGFVLYWDKASDIPSKNTTS